MTQIPYILNQLVAHIPRDYFDRLVKRHNGNKAVKSYSCWNHLLVMIWAQLTSRRSLRDIETSLRVHSDKTYRLGIGHGISRNNISHALAHRDVAIFRDLAQEMMKRAAGISVRDDVLDLIARGFGLSGFFAIDSSTVSLDLRKFSWSIPQKEWGGIKLHTMFDLLRHVPRLCLITGHEERDQTFMNDYPYEPCCFYVFDKMYFKAKGLYHVHTTGAYYVTRIKDNVVYEIQKKRPVDGTHVLADQTIRFSSRWAKQGYPEPLRLISFYSPEKNAVLKFVTNNTGLDAATIALLYRYRWQIELFFKWIKQHLRITTFYGTSANAVMSQIYIAYISYCTLALAADATNHEGSLYEFANIMSVALTEKIMLKDLISRYKKEQSMAQIDHGLSLFDFDNLPTL